MNRVALILLLSGAVVAQAPTPDPAAGTNEYGGMPLRNEPRVAWEVKPRYRDSSAFALTAGVLVTGNTSGHGGTFGYDAANGKLLWSVPGHIRGGPAVHAGFAFAVNDTGERYRFALRKLDARTGKAAWSVVEEDLGNHDGPPVVVGDVVVVASRKRTVAAYDLATGAERWRHEGLTLCTGRLAAADGRVFLSGGLPGSPFTLTALDAATGQVRWGATLTALDRSTGCGTRAAVADGRVVIGIGRDLQAFDAVRGERLWVRPGPPPLAGRRQNLALDHFAAAGGRVYTASTTTVFATNLADGAPAFEVALPGPVVLDTVRLSVVGDVLYLLAVEQQAERRGPALLFAIALDERRVLWRHHTARPDKYDALGSWSTNHLQPADDGLFYESQQLLVRLVSP